MSSVLPAAVAQGPLSETAAQHLVTHVPRARPQDRADEVQARLAGARYEALDAVYGIDDIARLIGLVPLAELMAAAPAQPLAEIMNATPPRVPPDMDQEHVASLAIDAGVSAVPVVGATGQLLGCVPAPALIAILRREHIEDMHRLVGIR